MELRSRKYRSFQQSRPIAPCAQCGHTLFGPEWSEPVDDCRIRHLWECQACGYAFETVVRYPVAGMRPD
jgi:ribosomal protein L37AE/L43A